ncbi:MAG: aminopeptidase P N-terminal domain-containing protein, partial [Pseudomonadales bacterium]|nr:aminopeptidase P N-terminal domain-containing protein [Pseudomonadales bacterium]
MSNRIPKSEFKRRRTALMGLMEPDSIAVIPGAGRKLRNRDTEYLFRQDSDFHYLTGFGEPDALLVLAPGRAHGEVILFCRERHPRAELYDGERMGPERAGDWLEVDDGFPISDLDEILPGMLEGRERIYITLGEYPDFDERLMRWVSSIRARESGGAIPPGEFVALKHLLHEQRLYKSAAEIRVMREAARITCLAHERAMRNCRPGMNETQLQAELIYEFMRHGARSEAYPSIVGGGENGCVLHYVRNDAVLRKPDLVLIDAGCEFEHYAADVTRTFPVSGRYSRAQAALYDIVLEANQQAIAACRPGVPFNEPHQVATRVMVDGLLELGLLTGDAAQILESEAYRPLCPHNTSHWLGSDVHDVGDYRVDGAWRELEPGMVLTIE